MKLMSICLAQYLWFSSWGSYWPCSFSWFRGNLKNLSNLSCSSLQNLSICPCNDNYYDHTIYWYVLRFTSCLISISSKLESFFVWRVKVGFISCHFESPHSLLGPRLLGKWSTNHDFCQIGWLAWLNSGTRIKYYRTCQRSIKIISIEKTFALHKSAQKKHFFLEFFLKESSWWALFNRLKIANLEKWWFFTLDDTLIVSRGTSH